jgi:hypothetical protein
LYSFTGWQASNPTAPPPGDRMDADYDNTNTALTQTLSWAATSLNTDGSLKAGTVGQSQLVSGLFDDIAQDIIAEVQPLVDQAESFASAAGSASITAQAAATAADHSNTTVSGTASTATAAANAAIAARDTAQTYATTAQTAATNAQNADNHATGEAALAQDYADVTQAWAEHMPDTIPPNILAVMGITGDHWSSRWWANQAAQIVEGGGAGGPFLPLAGGTVSGPLNVTTTGATRSWAVQDRFAEVVDVQDFGQIGTGNAAIDTATMLAAVAALPTNGGVLKVGGIPTSITLNQTITITKSCKIQGNTTNGWASSIVCLMSGPAILFSDPTPSYQKTFEVENVRFVANNQTGPTQSAIRVNIGPTGAQAFPSFIGRNITISNSVASAASPYAQTFTRGIEFVPTSVGGAGIHNFWNVVLENIFFLGSSDSGTGQPIAGTAGIAFGRLVAALFRFIHVSVAASGFYQTDYSEGILAQSCQLYTVTNGWNQGSFAPIGASNVKLLEPVMIGSMVNASQSAINLDCVYIGQFQDNYLTGAGAVNVLLSNVQATQVCNNFLNTGTTGISLTRPTFNEGGNLISGNILTNNTTHINFGTGTNNDLALDNSTGGISPLAVVNNGTNNIVRGPAGPMTFANNQSLNMLDASGVPVQFTLGADNHFGLYSTNASGASFTILDFYAHTATPALAVRTPISFTAAASFASFTSATGPAWQSNAPAASPGAGSLSAAITGNFSNGLGEVDFWNRHESSLEFRWYGIFSGNPLLLGTMNNAGMQLPGSHAYYINNVKVLDAQITGWGTPTGPSRIANFPGASATLVQCSNAIAQIIADLKTHGMLGA